MQEGHVRISTRTVTEFGNSSSTVPYSLVAAQPGCTWCLGLFPSEIYTYKPACRVEMTLLPPQKPSAESSPNDENDGPFHERTQGLCITCAFICIKLVKHSIDVIQVLRSSSGSELTEKVIHPRIATRACAPVESLLAGPELCWQPRLTPAEQSRAQARPLLQQVHLQAACHL